MTLFKEPPFKHGKVGKSAVLLINLGTPDAPNKKSVRRYLKQFLSDSRVVEIPRVIWWVILHCFVLPFRSSKSAHKYASIWTEKGSPLKHNTSQQASMLNNYLKKIGHNKVQVAYAMRYGSPSISEVLNQLKVDGCEQILIFPAYPQYSSATTASIYDAIFKHYMQVRNIPEMRFIKHYHDHHAYIQALKESVLKYWEIHGMPDKLIISFHGVPEHTLFLGDTYHCECQKTGRLLGQELNLDPERYDLTFQSRFGKAEWLKPYTALTLQALADQGINRVDVICPGFTSDCLETMEEISIEARQDFLEAGGKEFHFIPCLNYTPSWISAMATIVMEHMTGWPTRVTGHTAEILEKQAEESYQYAMRMGSPH